MKEKEFKTIKNNEDIKELLSKFDLRHSFIKNIELITGKSHKAKDNKARTDVTIESKDGKVMDLCFNDVIIMHYPCVLHNNEEIITPTIEYKNGYFYFSNNTNLLTEANYRSFNNTYIKCKDLCYKVLNN